MSLYRKYNNTALILLGFYMTLIVTSSVLASDDDNIIDRIISAPVVMNGLIGGAPTEFNVVFNASNTASKYPLDPQNFGHKIPVGGRMEIALGGSYQRNPAFTNTANNTNLLIANRNVILTIAPQGPIVATKGSGVQHGNWTLVDNGKRLLTIIPQGSGLENGRAHKIGVKVLHIRPFPRDPRTTMDRAPFINGAAGTKGTIKIRIVDAKGKIVDSGYKEVIFRKAVGPQIRISNAGLTTSSQGNPATVSTELVESVHFQRVRPNAMLTTTSKHTPFSSAAPYALRFLLFDGSKNQPDPFIPQRGLANIGYHVNEEHPLKATIVIDSNKNGIADKEDKKIGEIKLKGPKKGTPGQILPNNTLTTAPNSANGSVFNVLVKAGSTEGAYRIKIELEDSSQLESIFFVEK